MVGVISIFLAKDHGFSYISLLFQEVKQMESTPKVGFVSLGCAKALVDSERILTQLRAEGYDFSPSYVGADVVVVNTCGFLDTAREESLSAIGEALNENGKVIVTGCLGAEPEVIYERFPQVMAITGPHNYEAVLDAVHKASPPKHDPYIDLVPTPGVKLTPRHYAYLKISEGCNNRCSFCIIPKLRGDLVSRPIGEVIREAEILVKSGVKELLVISQDTSAYGIDVKYAEDTWRDKTWRTKFIDLCRALGELGAWTRLHYVYPYPHVDEVIELMADGKILPYLDIPFQHASPAVLKAMKRPAHQGKTFDRIQSWRKTCPDLTVRSTFIVGFPGETDEDFEFLLHWIKEAGIDRAGCFRYEPVKGATSNAIADHVPTELIEERWNRFMQVQQEISAERLARKVGSIQSVMIDEVSRNGIIGRTKGDAPEIDGVVHISGKPKVRSGDIIQVMIESSDEYDLFGCAAS